MTSASNARARRTIAMVWSAVAGRSDEGMAQDLVGDDQDDAGGRDDAGDSPAMVERGGGKRPRRVARERVCGRKAQHAE